MFGLRLISSWYLNVILSGHSSLQRGMADKEEDKTPERSRSKTRSTASSRSGSKSTSRSRSREREDFKKLFECSICSDDFQDPRDLDCGHTFCLACLKRAQLYFNTAANEELSYHPCSECKRQTPIPAEGFEKLRINYRIKDFVARKDVLKKKCDENASEESDSADGSPFVLIRDLKENTHAIYIEMTAGVDELKKKVEEITGVPSHQQRLVYSGQQLENGMELSKYKVQIGGTVQLLGRLRGGRVALE